MAPVPDRTEASLNSWPLCVGDEGLFEAMAPVQERTGAL